MQDKDQLYVTPRGSNDDWYWLYGVVKAGEDGLLVSNDEMRDHIFELLRPRFFLKWKAHHQCKYQVQAAVDLANLISPPTFTTCVQQISRSGTWMLPASSSRWLCARMVDGMDDGVDDGEISEV